MNIMKWIFLFCLSTFGAVTKITMPTDFSSVASGTRANLKANFDETQTRFNAAADSIDEARGRMSGYTGDFTLSALDNLRVRLDTDGSMVAKFFVANGYAGDTLFRVTEDSTWKFWGPGTGTKITLSDSILASTARISGLTASRLMATNAGSTLASVSDLTAWIAGTSNQITSTSDGDGSITLSIPNGFTLPSASPTFAGLTLIGNATVGGTQVVTGVQTNSEAIVLSGNGTGGAGRLFNSTTNGMVLRANTGSSYDFYLFSAANNSLIRNPTGGSTLEFPGAAVSVGGTFTLSTLSSGRIPVVSTSGLITQDNLYWDATNDRLGIGSGASSPAYGLDVAGTMRVTGAATFTTAPTFSSVTASEFLLTDGSKALTSVAGTGTGSVMRSASPTTTGTLTGAAANFSGAVTASQITLGGGEAFTYGDTSFTLTATGMTTSPTGTAIATRIGNIVNLCCPPIVGTSNANTFTLAGIPSGWYPNSSPISFSLPSHTDNSASEYNAGTIFYTNMIPGVLQFYRNGSSTGWTSSGTKANSGFCLTYNLQ